MQVNLELEFIFYHGTFTRTEIEQIFTHCGKLWESKLDADKLFVDVDGYIRFAFIAHQPDSYVLDWVL